VTPEELKRGRRQLGMSQTELAEKIGVHGMTVSRWERGTIKVPAPIARLIELLMRERHASQRREQ
jgi:DNA-binding transcriptional regulator YiaG